MIKTLSQSKAKKSPKINFQGHSKATALQFGIESSIKIEPFSPQYVLDTAIISFYPRCVILIMLSAKMIPANDRLFQFIQPQIIKTPEFPQFEAYLSILSVMLAFFKVQWHNQRIWNKQAVILTRFSSQTQVMTYISVVSGLPERTSGSVSCWQTWYSPWPSELLSEVRCFKISHRPIITLKVLDQGYPFDSHRVSRENTPQANPAVHSCLRPGQPAR